MVVLQADPYCDELYYGNYKQATVFVVAYATEREQLFKRADRTAALKLAKEQKLTFDQVVARSCCHHLMVARLGS